MVVILGLTAQAGGKSMAAAKFWEVDCDSVERMSDRYLRDRWTWSQVALVTKHIGEGRDLDSLSFLKRYPKECDFYGGFDLRGIRFPQPYLLEGHKLQLPFVHLEKSMLFTQSFKEAFLHDAHFEESNLVSSDFSGAQCHEAHFNRATAVSAKFVGTVLFMCDFHGANLGNADFTEADLHSADFSGALLVGANFSQAELSSARFKNTFLDNARLDKAHCRHIHWDGYYIGEETNADLMARALEEPDAHRADVRYKRDFQEVFGYSRKTPPLVREDIMTQAYLRAKLTYRYLKNIYQSYDLTEIAKEFHYRENCVTTKLSSNPFSWLVRKLLFEWTYGYGSRPWRLLWSSAAVIGFFALGFLVMSVARVQSGVYRVHSKTGAPTKIATNSLKDVPCVLGNSFYFSLLTFVTFGYGTITPQQWVRLLRLEEVEVRPVRWARIVAALESLAGIYLLALFAKVIFGG
jgi:uncharacterized protein YjbI with pentapeptide repeats